MKRLIISGFTVLAMLNANAQGGNRKVVKPAVDSSQYQRRKVSIDEINLVSSYYHQEGDHGAVLGGEGSQKLTDIANVLDVKLVKDGKVGVQHALNLEMGIDHYTSASSDRIDLVANSSASAADTRYYPSITFTKLNEINGRTYSFGASGSKEYDYLSLGLNASISQKTKNKNGELTAKVNGFFDQVKIIKPFELRDPGYQDDETKPRTSISGSIGYTQLINPKLQVAWIADVVRQQGYLSMPFYRVLQKGQRVAVQEKLPDNRLKIPIAFRANYFAGGNVIFRFYYRYYFDTWNLNAHTANLEVPVKLSPFLSLSPFYRYYSQQGTSYFKPIQEHEVGEEYYTSNYDLSSFKSHFLGLNVKYTPEKGVFGIRHLQTLELRYGYYTRSNTLTSQILSLALKYK